MSEKRKNLFAEMAETLKAYTATFKKEEVKAEPAKDETKVDVKLAEEAAPAAEPAKADAPAEDKKADAVSVDEFNTLKGDVDGLKAQLEALSKQIEKMVDIERVLDEEVTALSKQPAGEKIDTTEKVELSKKDVKTDNPVFDSLYAKVKNRNKKK